MDYYKISHRTLNLFLFILRGYKTLAKRFSSAPTRGRKEREGEKREREEERKREKTVQRERTEENEEEEAEKRCG